MSSTCNSTQTSNLLGEQDFVGNVAKYAERYTFTDVAFDSYSSVIEIIHQISEK